VRSKEIYEVVFVGEPKARDTIAMLDAVRKSFLPGKALLFKPTTAEAAKIIKIAPFIEPMTAQNGRATAYVCENFACKWPTTHIFEMLENLRPKIEEKPKPPKG
jgi:hypothetical protein